METEQQILARRKMCCSTDDCTVRLRDVSVCQEVHYDCGSVGSLLGLSQISVRLQNVVSVQVY